MQSGIGNKPSNLSLSAQAGALVIENRIRHSETTIIQRSGQCSAITLKDEGVCVFGGADQIKNGSNKLWLLTYDEKVRNASPKFEPIPAANYAPSGEATCWFVTLDMVFDLSRDSPHSSETRGSQILSTDSERSTWLVEILEFGRGSVDQVEIELYFQSNNTLPWSIAPLWMQWPSLSFLIFGNGCR